MIAAGEADGSIQAEAPPEDLYDAIYGSLFYRYVFGIAPITPGYARNLVAWCCGQRANSYFAGRTGAEILSVRSRSVMSTTVSIGAVNS